MKRRLFIGSSSESLDVADWMQVRLEKKDVDVTVWDRGIFHLSQTYIESLVASLERHDFAAFVLGPDDELWLRDKRYRVPRDNVVFELGLYMGRLGRESCFLVTPKKHRNFKLPSDLAGVSTASYDHERFADEPEAAVATACTRIKRRIKTLSGPAQNSRRLAGDWEQTWTVDSLRRPASNASDATVLQAGQRVTARWKEDDGVHRLDGTVRGSFVSGTWGPVGAGGWYHGAFQLRVHAGEQRMTGRWVGFNRAGDVETGGWKWKRPKPPKKRPA